MLPLGPIAAPSAVLSFCPGVHPKSPLVGLSKNPKQSPRTSNVLCERASLGKELRARLRSEKAGMWHFAEVMTHAAVLLLHLHRPAPRNCLRGAAPRAAWVAGREKLAPARGSPAAPAPGTAGSGCPTALHGASRRGPAGESVSPGSSALRISFVCVRGVLRGRRALFRGRVRKYRGLLSVTEFLLSRFEGMRFSAGGR